MKDNLFPPTDRALAALLDDLDATGQLDENAGRGGRRVWAHPQDYVVARALQIARVAIIGEPCRACCSLVVVWRGGNVIGRSDAIGAFPADQPVTPEDFAATIYHALGISKSAEWHDASARPHQVYHGEPIVGLMV